jgi:GSH-dependent disulfide-bond oxidoreductase
MFQMAAVGPMFGQLGFFHKFAGREIEDPRPKERYRAETQRLLGVLEQRLATRKWMMGDTYTIADIAIVGWIKTLTTFYMAGDLVNYAALVHVPRWYADMLARPAVARGLDIPKRPA